MLHVARCMACTPSPEIKLHCRQFGAGFISCGSSGPAAAKKKGQRVSADAGQSCCQPVSVLFDLLLSSQEGCAAKPPVPDHGARPLRASQADGGHHQHRRSSRCNPRQGAGSLWQAGGVSHQSGTRNARSTSCFHSSEGSARKPRNRSNWLKTAVPGGPSFRA